MKAKRWDAMRRTVFFGLASLIAVGCEDVTRVTRPPQRAAPAADVIARVTAAGAQVVSWTVASPMHKARAFFASVQLLNGNVLVAGGFDGAINGPPNFAESEIYDWHAGTWMVVSPMNQARSAPVALRLEDGRVMVIGGFDEFFNVLASAEIYDPRSNTWSLTAAMNDARLEDFAAVLLPGRKVLVAGGAASDGVTSLSSAEIFDETTGTWSRTGSMNIARGEFATAVLHDGRVLATGGFATDLTPIAAAEIYDPVTGVWTRTENMHTARADHAAVRLLDGQVLVAGGKTLGDVPLTAAEIFDPRSGRWTPTSDMTSPHSEIELVGVLLPDGKVLVAGGFAGVDTPQSGADLYDPRTGTWTQAGFMSDIRAGHAAVVLPGNRGVLVMGGLRQPPAATASVDIGRTH